MLDTSLSFLLLLVIETALASATSFSTRLPKDLWNFSPNNVPVADTNDSELNLLHDESISPRICALLICEVNSDALPIIHIVCCMRVSTSVAGTTILWLSSSLASARPK